eukprot:268319_1
MANHIININKWDKQKQSPIGKNIMLRFGSQGFSLGISYSQKGKQIREFGLNADELLNRIGKLGIHFICCVRITVLWGINVLRIRTKTNLLNGKATATAKTN